MRYIQSLLFYGCCMISCAASSAEEVPNYFVAPISTELQRATVSSNADTYAVVNCNALIVDDDVNLSALNEPGFVAALKNATPDRSSLRLVCRYQFPESGDRSLRKRLEKKLSEIAATAGYQDISSSQMSTSAAWIEDYQRVDPDDEIANAKEPLTENRRVRVFPVTTRLSKFVHGDTDCIVEIIHPIDGRTTEISADLKSSIREAVQSTELSQKHTLLFKLSSTEAGRETIEKLFDARLAPKAPDTTNPALLDFFTQQKKNYTPSPALLLAQELGFERIQYSHSPGGGAPEKLIGEPAPNFKLTQLSGTELELQSFIKDRPALITFWGLACGPCRKEAPWLSAMHDKYSPHVFSFVAVNGYNDQHEAVAEYVKDEHLSHPIVLGGRVVSDNLYHVGAYPTTFWVDSKGNVIDYEVGFTSPEQLEDRIKQLLGDAESQNADHRD